MRYVKLALVGCTIMTLATLWAHDFQKETITSVIGIWGMGVVCCAFMWWATTGDQ